MRLCPSPLIFTSTVGHSNFYNTIRSCRQLFCARAASENPVAVAANDVYYNLSCLLSAILWQRTVRVVDNMTAYDVICKKQQHRHTMRSKLLFSGRQADNRSLGVYVVYN